jgi:hypothetical protein
MWRGRPRPRKFRNVGIELSSFARPDGRGRSSPHGLCCGQPFLHGLSACHLPHDHSFLATVIFFRSSLSKYAHGISGSCVNIVSHRSGIARE